jgi:hypothetical protein
MTSENNPKISTIDEVITILGSTCNDDVIICSNKTYNVNCKFYTNFNIAKA